MWAKSGFYEGLEHPAPGTTAILAVGPSLAIATPGDAEIGARLLPMPRPLILLDKPARTPPRSTKFCHWECHVSALGKVDAGQNRGQMNNEH